MPTSGNYESAPTAATINEWLALVVSKADAVGRKTAITFLGDALPEWLAQWWTRSPTAPDAVDVLATLERIYSLRNETMNVASENNSDSFCANECQPVLDAWQWELIPALLNCAAITALIDPLDLAVVVVCHRLLHYYTTTISPREGFIIYQGYLAQQLSPDIVIASDVASTAWALHYLLITLPRLRMRNPVAFLSDLLPLLTGMLAQIPYQAAFHSVSFSRGLWEQLASTLAPSHPPSPNDIRIWFQGNSVVLPNSSPHSSSRPSIEAPLVNPAHRQLAVGVHHLSLAILWLVEQLYPLGTPSSSADTCTSGTSNALTLAMAQLMMGVFNIWVPDATSLAEQWFMAAQKQYSLPDTSRDRPQILVCFACLASKLPQRRQFLDCLMVYVSDTLGDSLEYLACCCALLALLLAASALPDLIHTQPSRHRPLFEPFPFLQSWHQSQPIDTAFTTALVECLERSVVYLLRQPRIVEFGTGTSSHHGVADYRGHALLLALVFVQYSQLIQHTPRLAASQLGRSDSVLDALFAFCCTGSANQRLISFRVVHAVTQRLALADQTQLLTQWVQFLDSSAREHDTHWFHAAPAMAKDGVVQIYTDTLAKASVLTLCAHLLKDQNTQVLWRQLFNVKGWSLSGERAYRDTWQDWLAAASIDTKQLGSGLVKHVMLQYGAFMVRLANLWLFVLLRCQVDQAVLDNVCQRYRSELDLAFFHPIDRLLTTWRSAIPTDTIRSTVGIEASTTSPRLTKDSVHSEADITRPAELLEMTVSRIAELYPKDAH
ncbi:hypothetical protein H4R35_004834 [Dimargaris xerosporica]|nr:hypothetical protein H4R35_004834 [Dimargaris xerosporica]